MAKKTSKKSSRKTSTTVVSETGTTAINRAQSLGLFKDEDLYGTNLDDLNAPLPSISTGSIVLDSMIGGKINHFGILPCPGFPCGRIINMYGMESSGKTTVALSACAAACRLSETSSAVYIDFEHAVSPMNAKTLGVPIGNPSKFSIFRPSSLEEGIELAWGFAEAGVNLIVFDSVSGSPMKDELGGNSQSFFDKKQLGRVATKWSKILGPLQTQISKTSSTIIGISQLRANPTLTGYGPKFNVQGGNAWKFYSSLRVMLKRIGKIQIKGEDIYGTINKKTIGIEVKAKLDKCKISGSYDSEEVFFIDFEDGIDNLRTMIRIGIGKGFIRKRGSWFTWETPSGDSISAQGEEKLKAEIRKACLEPELWQLVKPFLEGTATEDPLGF